MKKISVIASILMLLSTLLNADITIKNGWHLLGATQDINTSIFDNTCVDYIWEYDSTDINNVEWKTHIANEINYNNSITPITSLTKGEGYWVKGNGDCTISLAEPVVERYSRSASGVVTDHDTYLQWQDDTVNDRLVWFEAGIYCDDLELDGVGWRLPSKYELVGIVEDTHEAPIINPVFENTTSAYYWSSTHTLDFVFEPLLPGMVEVAYGRIVSFNENIQGTSHLRNAHYFRCVRTGQ